MRRLLLACALLLIAVPAAGAKSFEAETLEGDLAFRADPSGQASVAIDWIGAGARISGPPALGRRGIACKDATQELADCATLKRTKKGATWTILAPVSLTHMQMGDFTITLRKAGDVRGVFISGCGEVRLAGTGAYSADGQPAVSYTPASKTVVITLEP